MTRWWCRQDTCNKLVADSPTFHDFLAHETKTWVYRCPFCAHRDVVGNDFADHLLLRHAVSLKEKLLARLFATRRCASFKKLGYCGSCGLRTNENVNSLRMHKHTCAGYAESEDPIRELDRTNIMQWWRENEEFLRWAYEPDLDLIPKVEESASNRAVCTWRDAAQQPTRRAWTLMERRHYEAANVPFAIEATADIMPRFAAYHVTHLRVYFELRLAAGTYHLRQQGLYMGRLVVRTLRSDTVELAKLSAADVLEGAIMATQLEWPVVIGYVSFDRYVKPGAYDVRMEAAGARPQQWRAVITDSLFLA